MTYSVFYHGQQKRKTKLIIGAAYRVEPMNPQKMKHRGREGRLSSKTKDGYGRLHFSDTGGVGTVDLSDLVLLPD